MSGNQATDPLGLAQALIRCASVTPADAGLAYSDIAAATISALCERVEQRFAEAHGGFDGQRLAVLGLGKLGSREMSATSDLDLIFVYDIPDGMEASDGAKPLFAYVNGWA